MSEEKIPTQRILKLNEILALDNLNIPEYQRPYEWTDKQVNTLLSDIDKYINQSTDNIQYIMGSIIIQKDEELNLNIVDGQQRLVTFSLLLHALGDNGLKLMDQPFSEESKAALQTNYAIINKWLLRFEENEKKKLLERIKSLVCFFYFEVETLEEAFQLFDTQNNRGKKLKPTALLKAFHLRQISDHISEEKKMKYAQKWDLLSEKEDNLFSFIQEHLFRIRAWCLNGEFKYYFTNEDLDIFKGIMIQPEVPNFIKKDVIVLNYFNKIKKENIINNYADNVVYPFQIDQIILNGENFFEYVFHYYRLFMKENFIQNKYEEYFGYCISSRNTGDYYLKNLLENFLLYADDRFGNVPPVHIRHIMRNIYSDRLIYSGSYSRITTTSVKNRTIWFSTMSKSYNLDFLDKETDFNIVQIKQDAQDKYETILTLYK